MAQDMDQLRALVNTVLNAGKLAAQLVAPQEGLNSANK
jgi:hypothetical protein